MQLDITTLGGILPALYFKFYVPLISAESEQLAPEAQKELVDAIVRCALRDTKKKAIDYEWPQYINQMSEENISQMLAMIEGPEEFEVPRRDILAPFEDGKAKDVSSAKDLPIQEPDINHESLEQLNEIIRDIEQKIIDSSWMYFFQGTNTKDRQIHDSYNALSDAEKISLFDDGQPKTEKVLKFYGALSAQRSWLFESSEAESLKIFKEKIQSLKKKT